MKPSIDFRASSLNWETMREVFFAQRTVMWGRSGVSQHMLGVSAYVPTWNGPYLLVVVGAFFCALYANILRAFMSPIGSLYRGFRSKAFLKNDSQSNMPFTDHYPSTMYWASRNGIEQPCIRESNFTVTAAKRSAKVSSTDHLMMINHLFFHRNQFSRLHKILNEQFATPLCKFNGRSSALCCALSRNLNHNCQLKSKSLRMHFRAINLRWWITYMRPHLMVVFMKNSRFGKKVNAIKKIASINESGLSVSHAKPSNSRNFLALNENCK